MSTPVKPPGGTPTDVPDLTDTPEAGGGEFRAQVEGGPPIDGPPSSPDAGAADASIATEGADRVADVDAALQSGAIDADAAIDQLVGRAMQSARGLPEAERSALEARLREALSEDPTLVALRRDLERASAP